jgi:hypothetical protein
LIPEENRIREVEFVGRTWYVVAREYRTVAAARQAWQQLESAGARAGGAYELGVYRHEAFGDAARFVTAVGHVREGAEAAERILGGEDVELPAWAIEGMIARRIRVMAALEAEDAPSGMHIVRRPEAHGGYLTEDGHVSEWAGRDE